MKMWASQKSQIQVNYTSVAENIINVSEEREKEQLFYCIIFICKLDDSDENPCSPATEAESSQNKPSSSRKEV